MDSHNKKAIEIYDRIAEDYAKNFDHVGSEEDLIFLNTFLLYLKFGSYVVDLGCGTGFSCGYFVKKGMRVDGCDLSPAMIRIAKRNYPQLQFFIEDMRTFSPQEKVDAVWAGYSLFFFEQESLEKTIKHLKTYLKSGGILGLVVQEGDGEVEQDVPFALGEKIYLQLYTEEQIINILEKYGFEILETKRKKPKANEHQYSKLLLIAKQNKI